MLARARIPLVVLASLAPLACTSLPGPDVPATPNPTGPASRVVALGDSFAAGQGAPDEPWRWWRFWESDRPRWESRRCDRSRFAPARAAVERLRALGRQIAFFPYACSGAEIESGLLGPYAGAEPQPGDADLPGQLAELAARAAEPGGVQAVTLSIGGNDILFAFIVEACVVASDCDVIQPLVDQRLAALPARLEALAGPLDAIVGSERWRVLVTEYPDPTRDSDGSPCDRSPRFDALERIDGDESRWAAEHVLAHLNHRICTVAQSHGWTWVPGAVAAFAGHGWCAGDNWINTHGDSEGSQRSYQGTLHPNPAGYAALAGLLETSLASVLDDQAPPVVPCPPAPS